MAKAKPAPAALPAPEVVEEVKDERTIEEKVEFLLAAVEALKHGKHNF